MATRQRLFWKRIEACRLWLLVLGVLLLGAGQVRAQQTEARTASKVDTPIAWLNDPYLENAARLSQPLRLTLEQVTREQALRIIAQQAGLRLSYEWSEAMNEPVTLRQSQGTVLDALYAVTAGTDLRLMITRSGYLLVGRAPKSSAETAEPAPVQQEGSIAGRVIDAATGEGLPGVNVFLVGTTLGASTDIDGNYRIDNIPAGLYTLQASFIGYRTATVDSVEVRAGEVTVVNLALEQEVLGLEEIVVVGYGTQRRRDVTGAVSSVNVESLQELPVTNVVEALQTRAPGVRVITSDGRPGGSGLEVQIRGARSLTASNQPLFVIDGVPVEGVNLSELNLSDIVSIEVLKDASAAAIYGARGSNGVVLITTRRGREGEGRFSYDGSIGFSEIANPLDVFSGPEFIALRREAYRAAGMPTDDETIMDPVEREVAQSGQYVDWQEAVLRTGVRHNHNLSYSGGSDVFQVYASGGYLREEGILKRTFFERGTFRLNTDYRPISWLKFTTNFLLARTKQDVAGGERYGPFWTAYTLSPLGKIYDEQGRLRPFVTGDPSAWNPLYQLQESRDDRWSTRVLGNLVAQVNLYEGLNYQLNAGMDYNATKMGEYRTSNYSGGGQQRAVLGYGESTSYTIENILTYERQLGTLHNLHATLLYSVQRVQDEDLQAQTRNLPSDLLDYNAISSGADLRSPTRNYSAWSLESYMARLRYSFADRYLLTLTGRIDGSSKFGAGNKYGFFPAVAFAWQLSQEPFLASVRQIDNLKLRLSWGQTGNQEIPIYQSLGQTSLFSYSFGGNIVKGYAPASLPNPNLKWEKTTQFNLGLDASLFGGRIMSTIDLYRSWTSDLLLQRQIPVTNGFTSFLDNIGKTENWGIDFSLDTYLINRPDFSWQVNLNWSLSRSKIVRLTGQTDEAGNPVDDIANRWFIGHPIGVIYDWVFDGIFCSGGPYDEAACQQEIASSAQPDAQPGDIRVRDLNGDGVINDQDRTIVGTTEPDWYGGLGTTLTYKNFDLSVFFTAVQGVTRYNPYIYPRAYDPNIVVIFLQGRANQIAVDYWTPEDTDADFPRPNYQREMPRYLSARAVWDASYVQLRNITLGYTLPALLAARIGVDRMRLYLSGNNLYYWTDFESYNPEQGDVEGYPVARTLTFGVNLSF
jgi:TonB-linked SusC/RagA family outer membrane protein